MLKKCNIGQSNPSFWPILSSPIANILQILKLLFYQKSAFLNNLKKFQQIHKVKSPRDDLFHRYIFFINKFWSQIDHLLADFWRNAYFDTFAICFFPIGLASGVVGQLAQAPEIYPIHIGYKVERDGSGKVTGGSWTDGSSSTYGKPDGQGKAPWADGKAWDSEAEPKVI